MPKFKSAFRALSNIHFAVYEFTTQFYIVNVRQIFKDSLIDCKLFNNSFAELKWGNFQNNILTCKDIFHILRITGSSENFCFAECKDMFKCKYWKNFQGLQAAKTNTGSKLPISAKKSF